jgi:hypothetical protein
MAKPQGDKKLIVKDGEAYEKQALAQKQDAPRSSFM